MVRIVGVINFKEFEMTMVAANTVMEKIEEVLNEFVAEDRIFSAFDVTKRVREKAGKVLATHKRIQAMVHQIYTDGNFPSKDFVTSYIRILMPVDAAVSMRVRAWIYYPSSENPYDYDPEAVKNVTVEDDLDKGSPGKYSLTTADRLNVSGDLLNKIGAKPKDYIWISVEGEKMVLSPRVFPCANPGDQKNLIVNKDGRVRIPKKVIEGYLDCAVPSSFNIEIEKDYISISPCD